MLHLYTQEHQEPGEGSLEGHIEKRMLQSSDKQPLVSVDWEMHELISCYLCDGMSSWGHLSGEVCWHQSKVGKQPNSCRSQDEKTLGFRHALTLS